MKKLLKKFSVLIFFIISFAFVNCVYSEPPVQPAEQQPITEQPAVGETKTETLEDIPESIPEKNYENIKKIKESALTLKPIVIFAAGTFVIVLLIIFIFMRRGTKRWNDKGYIVSAPPKETLESPKDFNTAINLFLGKTDE